MSLDFLKAWSDITQLNASMAALTVLRTGGKAQAIVTPRTDDELVRVYKACLAESVAVYWLATGGNVLVREEGLSGVVIRISHENFSKISIKGTQVSAGAAALISQLISQTARSHLTGLEGFVGIRGTVGGALVSQMRSRTGTFSQATQSLDVLHTDGKLFTISREDFETDQITEGVSSLILRVHFQLEADQPEQIVKRLRKSWISAKSHQPMPRQKVVRMFRDPALSTASQCITQAGAAKLKVGGATLSERDPNYIVITEKAKPSDVLKLMDQVRNQVHEKLGQSLQNHLVIW